MNVKKLVAVCIAAAFAAPVWAQTKPSGAAGAPEGASAGAGASASGAEKMFQALDKNKDGFVSKEEAKGTPHDKDFATLDKNSDGKLSREEHAAAPEHAGDKSGAAGATGAQDKNKKSKY